MSVETHTIRTDQKIGGFFGEYRFLSNFDLPKNGVYFLGLKFPSSEHAFMYAKLASDQELTHYNYVIQLDCKQVKKWGRTVPLRPDWEDIKLATMGAILLDKFSRNEDIRAKLLATQDKELEETNWWGDLYWGRDLQGNGQNNLGKTLMHVRSILRNK